MKRFFSLIIFFSIILVGCTKEDGEVVIDSVYKNGNEFFQGQKIQVWVGAQVSDISEANYKWECSGGYFSGPTGLVQNVWVAPREAGEYLISCTVECEGKSAKRSTKMTVGEYFFDKFSVASTNFSVTNFKATYADGEALLVGSKSNTRGSYRRDFGDTSLYNPVTFSADMAWRTKYKNTSSSIYYRLAFNKPTRYDGSKVKSYIREVLLEIWPTSTGTAKNYSLDYEVFNSEFSTATWTNIISGRKPEFVFADGAKATDKKGMRPITFAVDGEYNIIVTLDGMKALESAAIKTWKTANTNTDKLNLKSAAIEVYEQTNFYLDNVILKLQ